MYSRTLIAGALLLASNNLFAQNIDIQLSNQSARFNYATAIWGKQYGRAELEAGALYNDKNTTNNYAAHVGLRVYNNSYESPLELSVGARLYYAYVAHSTALALALGGTVRYAPQPLHGFGLRGEFYYAPKVVSFNDANGFTEYGFGVDYQLMPQATVYLAYRNVKADIKNRGHLVVDKGTYVGVQMRF